MKSKILLSLLIALFMGANWADLAERSISEPQQTQMEYHRRIIENLKTRRGIPFNNMLLTDCSQEATPQCHSLALFLIEKGGRKRFLDCIREARLNSLENRWQRTFQRHYGFNSLGDLQLAWVAWITKNQTVYLTSS